jgi:hypothetical protein
MTGSFPNAGDAHHTAPWRRVETGEYGLIPIKARPDATP